MKIFLLPLDHAQTFFYWEDVSGDSSASLARGTDFRARSRRALERLRTALRHPKGKVGQKLKRAWGALQHRMHPDEPLLAALREARSIAIYHSAALETAPVRACWRGYLRSRLRRHLLWLLFDGALSPLSLLLVPLPGPNLIGYWFAYRAFRHMLILLGIRRALRGQVETTFRPAPALDASGGCRDGEWRAYVAKRYALDGLHSFVARIAGNSAAATAETANVSATVTGTVAEDDTAEAEKPCDC